MNRNSHNSRGSSVNPAPRWRIVFIALLLALVIGSAGQAPPVQAAPVGTDDIDFDLSVYPEKLPTICPNEKLTLYAGVSKTTYKAGLVDSKGKPIPIPGKAPGPIVTGKKISGVGTLENPSGSGGGGDELYSLQGQNDFVFTSNKPGTAKLKFTVTIQNSWIGAKEEVIGSSVQREKEITVKVIICKYKVNTVSIWKAGMTSVGTMDGEMKADEQGNFTGSASVNWVTSIIGSGGCRAESGIEPSKAELTGTVNDSGQLVGEVTFGPTSASGFAICGPVGSSTDNSILPDPLTIKASSEGVSVYTQSQAVTAKNGSFTGTATIVVVPVEDEAAAFNPGNLETRIGTLFRGWAMQWDGFLSLFGALLVLR